ncbi:2OG-Fe(II) oxygenase family protein [Jatrophihabitans lederbergiae]|uniref:2OG-Fe(II) oxygenase family protein n=1 Tax=Jatrophihabitans lederbergiae TaxID=3075547 RepID=A0ABU2JGU9_9ACTN|nr:2OG-Fe(II) oxygenase family protein [Jatrophihabitans sp. DSM 44399]MDT0263919.1 2OG-Fe(II) oxygenase family protein [Jatrophihabitans sp. DSM 44399]
MTTELSSDTLARAEWIAGSIKFLSGDMARALRTGCFFLAVPADLDLRPAVRFARSFFEEGGGEWVATDAYSGYRNRPDVYFDREGFQTEHVLIDQDRRAEYFDPTLNTLCDRLSEMTESILRAGLVELNVAKSSWDLLTQGAAFGRGTRWLAFNHYRPEKPVLGCTPHKDTGFVTVLYAPTPGLEGWNGTDWVPIDAPADHLIVNFGGSFEAMTAAIDTRVAAMLHRVRETRTDDNSEDRISVAAFANPPAIGEMYGLQDDGSVVHLESIEAFLRRFNDEAWGDEYTDFGIKVGGTHA